MPADGGIRFGPYVLLRRIARGGMAEVFLAQQRGLEGFDRRVAVKRILPHLADTTDFVKMFLGEARLAAQLSHPNIVHIYDFGKVENDYFIAMEFVDGIHAGQVFKHGEREIKMTPTLVARIGADAATALNYAHELLGPNGKPLGLVHRDVSPANIMISYDGVVKLCDFGIAKAMSAGDQLTNPGQVKGKYAYMSPEQTIAAPLDGRSDVFSLAICLWELLTGKTIVPRGDAVESMRMIRDGKLQPIEKAAPHTPVALAKAINWALATKRDQRATAADLAQALEAFIKASPEIATSMQIAQWVRTRFPRETSGQHSTLDSSDRSPRTNAAPGTSVAPGTMAGTVTPSDNLIAASHVHEPDETAETVALLGSGDISGLTSDERENAAILDELARDLQRHKPIAEEDKPTVLAGDIIQRTTDREILIDPSMRAAEESTLRDRKSRDNLFMGDSEETNFASGAFRRPVPSGPAVVPTRVQPGVGAISTRERRPSTMAADHSMGIQKIRRYLVPAIALVGVMIVSFLIALAARSKPSETPVDAPVVAIVDAHVIIVDAAPKPIDAPIDVAIDTPVEPHDAAQPTALLVLRTTPPDATLKVGDQVRTAPAELALPNGKYKVVAELDGFVPETREVTLERNERVVIEIAFTKHVQSPKKPPPGKLIVYTTPYSDVYDGTRKLGQTPFEIDIAPGTYTLSFKNPQRGTTSRLVKIVSGKPTRLKFDLPK